MPLDKNEMVSYDDIDQQGLAGLFNDEIDIDEYIEVVSQAVLNEKFGPLPKTMTEKNLSVMDEEDTQKKTFIILMLQYLSLLTR